MADPVRYFLDEHVPGAVLVGLRAHGVDVLTVHEAGRDGLPDDEQLRFATAAGRVVVTHDADYLTHAAEFFAAGEAFAGVAYSHLHKYQHDVGGLLAALLTVHGVCTADDMLNHVEYL